MFARTGKGAKALITVIRSGLVLKGRETAKGRGDRKRTARYRIKDGVSFRVEVGGRDIDKKRIAGGMQVVPKFEGKT